MVYMRTWSNVTKAFIGSYGAFILSFCLGVKMEASYSWKDVIVIVSVVGLVIISGLSFYFYRDVVNIVIKEIKRSNTLMETVATDSRDMKAAQAKLEVTQAELRHIFEDRALGLNTAIENLASASKSLEVVALTRAQVARPLLQDCGVTLTQARAGQPLLPRPGVLRLPPQPYISLTQAQMAHVPGVPRQVPGVRHVRFAVPLTQEEEEPRGHLRPDDDVARVCLHLEDESALYSVINESSLRPSGGGRESRERETTGKRIPGYPGLNPGPFKAPATDQVGVSGTRI